MARYSSLQTIRHHRPRKLLVVCHGNICRSPFAERLLRDQLKKETFEIISCGFHPRPGRPSPDDFVLLARLHGIDLGDHRSRVISQELVRWADCVIIMDDKNWESLQPFMAGGAGMAGEAGKVVWLDSWGLHPEIADPYGQNSSRAHETLKTLKNACAALANDLTT